MASPQEAPPPARLAENNGTASSSSGIPGPSEPPRIRLPIVRLLRQKTGGIRLIAIYDDHMVMATCGRTYSISESMLTVAGETDLTGQLHNLRRLEFSDVSGIRIHPGVTLSNFTLLTRSGRSWRFSLPKDQAGHVTQFLTEKLAGQVPFHRRWASKTVSILVVVLGLVGGLAALNLVNLDQRGLAVLVGFLALAVTVAGLWLLLGRGSPWPASQTGKAAPRYPARHAVAVAKPPLRSKPLGWALKLLGLAYWFILLSPLTDPLRDWLNSQMDAQSRSYIWSILWFPAPLLIFTGYRLCQRRYTPRQSSDPRKPILFLRPFQDDEHTSLQPMGLTAQATGIRAQSIHSRGGRTDIFDLLWSAHPIRVLRMIADYGAGSSEESIARFFERHGPVIAIGKPGEHLASPGAARMYLDDASWQDAVLCEMERAQAVVIQPAPSEGVRWELNHIREKVPPCRVLMCLAGYWDNPESYEDLCSVVAGTMRLDLPRAVPYLRHPAFVYFDQDWTPHVQELSYKDPVMWPVTTDAADLKYSLEPFVQGMQGGKHEPARPARWIGGPKSWVASLAAMALGIVLLVVPHTLVGASGELIRIIAAGKPILSIFGSESIPQTVANSPRIVLQGHAVSYQMSIPGAMVALKPDNAMVEHWRRSPDNRFDLQVVTDPKPEDLSNLAQDRLKANSEGAISAHLDSERQLQQAGVNWIEARISVTVKEGVSVQEIARGASTPGGTVFVVIHIVESPESDAVYQRLADESLQSFRFADTIVK